MLADRGFLLTGNLCLFAESKSLPKTQPAPVLLMARAVSVDAHRAFQSLDKKLSKLVRGLLVTVRD